METKGNITVEGFFREKMVHKYNVDPNFTFAFTAMNSEDAVRWAEEFSNIQLSKRNKPIPHPIRQVTDSEITDYLYKKYRLTIGCDAWVAFKEGAQWMRNILTGK